MRIKDALKALGDFAIVSRRRPDAQRNFDLERAALNHGRRAGADAEVDYLVRTADQRREEIRVCRGQKGDVHNAESTNQNGAFQGVIIGEAADLFEQRGHRRGEGGNAKNRCRRAPQRKRNWREFRKTSEELISLGFLKRDKFGGMGSVGHRREIAGVALEDGFVPDRFNNGKPRVSIQEIGAMNCEQFRCARINHVEESGLERRVHDRTAQIEGA